jgi:septal ring factor EnvC (AmiA/AmiB activator)
MEHIMTKTLSILVATLFLTVPAFAQQQVQQQQTQQQVTLDVLLDRYEQQQQQQQQQKAAEAEDPASEVRRLRSQLIDLRVERDALQEENSYLKNRLENMQTFEESECLEKECVPVDKVEEERILSYVIYSLSLYRMAEVVAQNTPSENVEAHKKAQRVMAGVKSDLDTLGFDTTNMQEYPNLEELIEELQIAQRMR